MNEGGVIVLVVAHTQARCAVVLPAGGDRGFVKGVHGLSIACAEGDVGCATLGTRPDPEVGYPFAGAEAGGALELHLDGVPKRRKCLFVEAFRLLEVADVCRDVVDHCSSFRMSDYAPPRGSNLGQRAPRGP